MSIRHEFKIPNTGVHVTISDYVDPVVIITESPKKDGGTTIRYRLSGTIPVGTQGIAKARKLPVFLNKATADHLMAMAGVGTEHKKGKAYAARAKKAPRAKCPVGCVTKTKHSTSLKDLRSKHSIAVKALKAKLKKKKG